MSHLSILNKLKKGTLVRKHPLSDQDLEFRYAYCFGIAFLACADKVPDEKEKKIVVDLMMSLELPAEYLEKILRAAEEPQEEMIQGLIEGLQEKKHKHIFLADLYRMSIPDAMVSAEDEEIVTSFAELLGVAESECRQVKELVLTTESRDMEKVYDQISNLINFNKEILFGNDDSLKTMSIDNLSHIQKIRSLQKDSFEYVDEYEKRINQMALIYCGDIVLKKEDYDIKMGRFPADVTWHECLQQIMADQMPGEGFYLDVSRDDAKSIFYAGVFQPVYIKFLTTGERLFIENIYIVVNEKKYEVKYEVKSSTSCSLKLSKQDICSGNCAYGIHLI